MLIRTATPLDFSQILLLNEESVHYLSPLDSERLQFLHDEAAYHRVVESSGQVLAFLLALNQGSAYDSPNYRWFSAHYERFLYIDRVVVSSKCQGKGIGHSIYADFFKFARQMQVARVTCEFHADPPNHASRRFHQSHGFGEVGTLSIAAGKKLVSLQAVSLLSAGSA